MTRRLPPDRASRATDGDAGGRRRPRRLARAVGRHRRRAARGARRRRLAAAIGPAIGPCCYEVGDEVAGPFRVGFGPTSCSDGSLDLWSAAERALRRSAASTASTASTSARRCHPDLFFSHRRDGEPRGVQGVIGACRLTQSASGTSAIRAEVGAGRHDRRRDEVRAARGHGGARRGRRRGRRGEPRAGSRARSTRATATRSAGTSSATCRVEQGARSSTSSASSCHSLDVGVRGASGSRSRRSSRSTSPASRRSRASTPEELPSSCAALSGDVRGLMTMPPAADDPEASRPYFRRLRELAAEPRAARAVDGDVAGLPGRGRGGRDLRPRRIDVLVARIAFRDANGLRQTSGTARSSTSASPRRTTGTRTATRRPRTRAQLRGERPNVRRLRRAGASATSTTGRTPEPRRSRRAPAPATVPPRASRRCRARRSVKVHLVLPRSFNDAQQIADRFKDVDPGDPQPPERRTRSSRSG